jgi:hypothetical protein
MKDMQVEQLGSRPTIETVIVTSDPYILAPVITDLITIYDDDSEDLDTTIVPIVNEVDIEILDTDLSQILQPMDMGTNLNISERITTHLGKWSQPQAEGGNDQERKEEDQDIEDTTLVGKGNTQDKDQGGALEDKYKSNNQGSIPEEKTPNKEESEEILYFGGKPAGDTPRSQRHEEKNDDEESEETTTKTPNPSSSIETTTPMTTPTKNVT